MYRSYWNLLERPFENTPDPRYLYKSTEILETYSRLLYAVKSNRGAVILTGDSGCGKTLLSRALIQELDPEKTDVALLANPCRNPEELLREILFQIGEEEQEGEQRSQILHRLNALLYENFSAGKETVVDEAQLLEDPGFFEELTLLLNLQLNDAFLLTLVLVGHPILAERIRDNEALDERLSARGVMRPLERSDVGPYIEQRLQVAGMDESVFAPDAIEMVAEYSGGIPRRINHLCDICLVIGYSQQVQSINEDLVYKLILNEEENRV
jgi:type II secretory pathway predicted ATPase ExeA